MQELIKAYLFVLVIMLITIGCMIYGYINDNSSIYFAGVMVFLPFFIISYQAYKEFYYEQWSVTRRY